MKWMTLVAKGPGMVMLGREPFCTDKEKFFHFLSKKKKKITPKRRKGEKKL